MTIQYPGKLDKSREIYFAIDNIYGGTGSPTSADRVIQNRIVKILKDAGLNVVRSDMGPGTLYDNMKAVYNANKTNAIIFNVMNGVDPSNLREVAVNGNDNRGRTVRARGNDAVLGWMWDACDFTREGGTCYNHVRGSETGTGMDNPLQYCQNNKIYALNCSSDSHNYPSRADYTGEKIANAFIALFEENSQTPDEQEQDTTDETTTTTTDETSINRSLASQTITKTYTAPYFERIIKANTDNNGAYKHNLRLPYKGEYKVTAKFAGDKTHNPATRTTRIYNYSNNSNLFKETLLHTKTVSRYTDGTVETKENGSIPKDNKHLKKEITTTTYNNGTVTNTSVRTIYLDDVVVENEKDEEMQYTPPDTNTNTDDSQTTTAPGIRKNPFIYVVNPVNDVPNVAGMICEGKSFEMVDKTKTYTLTLAQFKEVYNRDSQSMQLHNYKLSKYTAFRCTDDEVYHVISRTNWNAIVESVHCVHVAHNNMAWPDTFILDFPNHRTKVGSYWRNWKSENVYYYICGDNQNTGYTCGPTSGSICSQVFMNYFSEARLAREMGTTTGGTAPYEIAKGLRKHEFNATVVKTRQSTAIEAIKQELCVVWHIPNHYLCLAYYNKETDKVLVSNSSRGLKNPDWTVNGRMATGWNPLSNISNAFGEMVIVGLNWTLTAQQETRIRNFYKSMGGAWTPGNSQEGINYI